MYSAKILGKQMDTVYGLYLPEYTVPAPEAQTNFIEILGRDGSIDKSSPDGVVRYKDRNWTLVFKKTGEDVSADDVPSLSSTLMNDIHGRRGEVIFDDDDDYKWIGRVFVLNVSCENNGLIIVTINFISEPYKYGIDEIVVTDTIQTTAEEYAGQIASFVYGIGKGMTKFDVNLHPVQDLHGYSKPWAAGAGKNKLYVPAGSSTVNGTTFAVASDGSVTLTNAPTSNATKLVCTFTLPAGSYIYTSGITEQRDVTVDTFVQKSGTTIARGNNSDSPGNSFTLTEESTLNFDIRVHSGYNPNNLVVKPMIRLASVSDATWEPYSNICPITGRTGASVYRTGKNLCRVARGWASNQGITYTENADGTVHAKGTATAESFSASNVTTAGNRDSRCMYTVPAGTYTISNIAGVRLWVQFRNADNTAQTGTNVNIAVGASHTITFTEPAIIYIRSDIATGTVVDTDMQVMVTEGSTAATVYEPWQKQTVTVDWTSVAGTQYRGTLDHVTGKLTVTMANIESYNGETIGEPWLSSMDEYVSGGTPTTGAQVVYTLATPVEYQLTPQQVELLVGQNNIWSDAGDIDVVISVMDMVTLTNGRKPISPKINVTSEDGVTLLFEIKGQRYTVSLVSGEYKISDLVLFEGNTNVYEAGTGTIKYSYPEASL